MCHTDLLRTDAADHIVLHPFDHVLLLHLAMEVLHSNLVVQAPLHLIGHHVEPLSVVDLQQHGDIVLSEREESRIWKNQCGFYIEELSYVLSEIYIIFRFISL